MIYCENRNVGGAVATATTKRKQMFLTLSFMIVSVNSWVEKVHISYSKISRDIIIAQHVNLMKESSTRKNIPTDPRCRRSPLLRLASESDINFTDDDDSDTLISNDDSNLQWHLFCKHHARCDKVDDGLQTRNTSWVGKWSTHDYVGDVVLETIPASVNYIASNNRVDVTHTISTGSTLSDCETCYDDPNSLRTIPITTYTPYNIVSKSRLGACGMVVGPSIMRSSGTSKSKPSTFRR